MGIVLHGETRHDDASALEMAAREQEAAGVARMREAMGAMGVGSEKCGTWMAAGAEPRRTLNVADRRRLPGMAGMRGGQRATGKLRILLCAHPILQAVCLVTAVGEDVMPEAWH